MVSDKKKDQGGSPPHPKYLNTPNGLICYVVDVLYIFFLWYWRRKLAGKEYQKRFFNPTDTDTDPHMIAFRSCLS